MCDRLLAEGHTVVALDNFLTGTRANLSHLERNPNFFFTALDITAPLRVEIEGGIDCVVNMASPASPKDYLEHPIETLDVGSLGTRRMLELALEKNARFLLTSTSECYGDPLVHPQVETYWGNVNPVGPRSCYDESKRFAEALTMAYHRKHGVRTNIARIFNTYGPRMKLNDGRVVPAFLDQALRDEPMTVFGSGSQTRSFCYVSDLVDGLYRLMLSEERYLQLYLFCISVAVNGNCANLFNYFSVLFQNFYKTVQPLYCCPFKIAQEKSLNKNPPAWRIFKIICSLNLQPIDFF